MPDAGTARIVALLRQVVRRYGHEVCMSKDQKPAPTPAKMHRLHKLASDRARAPWGDGWSQLTDDLREALLAREAMMILLGQCDTMEKFGPAKTLVRTAMGWSEAPLE